MKQNNYIFSYIQVQSLFGLKNGNIFYLIILFWSYIIFKITNEIDYTVHKALEREIHSWRQKHPVLNPLETAWQWKEEKKCIKFEREKKGVRLWTEEQWWPKASNWLSFPPAQEFFKTIEAQYHLYIHFPNQDSRFFALSLPRPTSSVLQRRHSTSDLLYSGCIHAAQWWCSWWRVMQLSQRQHWCKAGATSVPGLLVEGKVKSTSLKAPQKGWMTSPAWLKGGESYYSCLKTCKKVVVNSKLSNSATTNH